MYGTRCRRSSEAMSAKIMGPDCTWHCCRGRLDRDVKKIC